MIVDIDIFLVSKINSLKSFFLGSEGEKESRGGIQGKDTKLEYFTAF